jgi:colanic acid biosynthesis glycosyl transferase WcaI
MAGPRMSRAMQILFLNQYFPPDPAPTGVLFRELAESLKADGHTVDFVAARQDYRPGQQKGGRMAREFFALGRMLMDGLRRPRPDVVISGSSPPCLLIVATLIAIWHRAKSIHWIMDLYPEIAVALGEVRDGAPARGLGALMGWCYRRAAFVVALDEDMAERVRRYGVDSEIIRPWVFASVLPVLEEAIAGARGVSDPDWMWIYSGNLGRAHEWKTLLEAQALLEKRAARIRLVFQGGGPSWPAAQACAAELRLQHCVWTGYAEEAELPRALLRAAVLVVTQLPETRGLLWPSKLGLALSLPRAILWIGPPDGAIAKMLRSFSHSGVFIPGQAGEIADWLEARRSQRAEVFAAWDPAACREESLEAWRKLVRRLL